MKTLRKTELDVVDRLDSMFGAIAGESVESRISEFNPRLVIVKFSSETGRDRAVKIHEQVAARMSLPVKLRNVRGLELRFDITT